MVGYTGVDYIDLEGRTWLEWGYRLVPECQALLAKADQAYADGGVRNLYTLPINLCRPARGS